MNFNWTYLFALYSDDTYGREGIESLIEELQEQNDTRRCIALKAALPLASTDIEDYDSVVQEMSKEWVRNASVTVLFGHLTEAVGIMDAIMRADNGSSLLGITWIASDSWALVLPETYHNLARGMLGILPHSGNVMHFRSYFNDLYPATSANPWFGDYWESVFNCSLMEPSCNNRNLSHRVTDAKVTNVIDAVYAFAHALDQMIVDHCPNETICTAITTTRLVGRAINGTLLREYLFRVSFPSTFSSESDILFDSNGDVLGSYLINNLQFTSENVSSFETVGTWDHNNLLQLTGSIEWNDGSKKPPRSVCSLPCGAGHEPRQVPDQEQCCWRCERCLGDKTAGSGEGRCYECEDGMMPNSDRSRCVKIPVTYFTWSSPWAISILCLTFIGIGIAIFVGVMLAIFHHKKILPFLFVVRPTPAVCGVKRFAIGFCFAISYSALLVRSNRIHRIFNQPIDRVSNPPRFIGAISQVVFTSILISVQVLIAVIWLAVEHPSVKAQQVDATTVELRCGASPYFGLSVSLIYNLILLLLSTYFAYLTRNVPDNFNEAKFINITQYSLCIIWVGFVPAYFVSIQFGTVYENFFLLLAVFLSASITLLCLLMPKIFIVFREEKVQRSEKTVEDSTKVMSIFSN